MKNVVAIGLALLPLLTACDGQLSGTAEVEGAIVESPRASAAIDEIVRSFSIVGKEPAIRLERGTRGVLGDPRALLPGLRVSIPDSATGSLRLSDDPSGVEIGVTLEGAQRSELEIGHGVGWFENGLGAGRSVLMKPRPDGVEDYVHFRERPAIESITYRVDVSRVKGVRFVEGVVEFLDARGVPRLRMARPYVFAKSRAVRPRVAVDDCAYDSDVRPPWDRPITPPLSKSCRITLAWSDLGVDYPALVDPVWSSAGVMSVQRLNAAAAIVESGGKKYGVVTGGSDATSIHASAEVFDPVALSWATTASMVQARTFHTATQLFASPASGVGQLVVAGGASSTAALASLERWDYATGTWTPLPSMNLARIAHGAAQFEVGALTDGPAILFTGGRVNGYEWVTMAEMLWHSDTDGSFHVDANGATIPRAEHSVVTVETAPNISYVWSIGGIGVGNGGTVVPLTTTRVHGYGESPGPNMARARARPGVALISGERAVVAGGEWDGSQTVEVVSVNGATVLGTICGSCNYATPSATKLLNGSVLVAGAKATQAWIADPDQPATLLQLPAMPTSRVSSLALAFDEFVALFGGQATPATATDVFRLLQNGESCQNGAVCGSKHCVDGVCCNAACSGACQACSATTKQDGSIDGVCGNAKAGTDPGDQCATTPATSCSTTGVCSAAGVCALHPASTPCGVSTCSGSTLNTLQCDGLGTCEVNPIACGPFTCGQDGECGDGCGAGEPPCNAGNFCSQDTCVPQQADGSGCLLDEQCDSGFCVDGFCCNTACGGQCEACDVTGYEGECRAVAGTPHGDRPACPGSTGGDACTAKICVASDTTQCAGYVGSEFACRPQSCSGGLETFPDSCNGSGKCPDPKTKECAPFLCGGDACKTSCESDADCVSNATCGSTGECVEAATCLDDQTAQSADGKVEPCGAYRCQAGACPKTCAEVSDCQKGKICNAERACVDPESAPDDDAVCSCRGVGRSSSGHAGALLLLLGVACLGRRRRRSLRAQPH